ncbi:prepilin peptidase [Sphingomonas profundi]|uniref:prepilin peptidase n=1 Tax=Alterirhizorhabdus profundi TaxID=2681549 RepID=UPI001E5D0978|nr:A24 family peptidase [Sphingomonas profundi]
MAGSYLATIVVRWPRGEAARGRSRCDGCGRTLGAGELVPLLSFAIAGGRCRACAAPIDRRHLAIEALATGIGAAALLAAPGPAGLAGALFGWLLLALAALDLEHYWLPNRLTAPLALLGLAGGIAGLHPALRDRLIGGVAGYAALAAIAHAYRALRGREGLGAGDAKLFGAIGLWLGWRALPPVLLAASLIGIAALIAARAGGRSVAATTRVPLGTLLAIAAWGLWLGEASGLGAG